MSADDDLGALAEAYGILPSFRDLAGKTQRTSPDTQRALLQANGLVLDNVAMVSEALKNTRSFETTRLHPREIIAQSNAPFTMPLSSGAEWQLQLEDTSKLAAEGRSTGKIHLDAMPSGVHTLIIRQGKQTEAITLIAAPSSCPSIEGRTGSTLIWGVNAALYAMRSSRNRGLGDFEDLAVAAETFAPYGADFLGINPVHSIGWADRETISPYSPSHRGFLNSAHIALDQLGGAQSLSAERDGDSEQIQYAAFTQEQHSNLENLYAYFCSQSNGEERAAFTEFCAARGDPLATFALYEALSEEHGSDWREWPDALRKSEPNALNEARAALAQRVQFHQWLQWLADMQLSDAQQRAKVGGMALGLYIDLAVGSRRGAAESWCEQDTVAQGVAIGAPPDHLSPDGQNWQLTAYAPAKLAQQKYASLRRIIAETMRHAGVLRIDHVLGMNRSYWIPDDGSPGGYIKQPFEALLAIVAIEAERSGTVIIGEDLGLVPPGFREALSERGLYSYSVLQYERGDNGILRNPDVLRPKSLLSFGTHDTPTLKGFWKSCDIDWWKKLGWIDEKEAIKAQTQRTGDKETLARLAATTAVKGKPPFSAVKDGVHKAMAASQVAMVSVQLDDLCEQVEAQNLPGTIDAHPNWRRRCPVPVEKFDSDLGLSDLASIMRACGRGRTNKTEREAP